MKYIKSFVTLITESANSKLELVNQPDAISCGPASLYMIAKYLDIATSVSELKAIMGTDYSTGTTDKKMILGLDYLSLDWDQFPVKNKELAYSLLDQALNDNKVVLFRTLTRGIKHWICCDYMKDGKYHILDPWLGEYFLSDDELNDVWEKREWDGFIIHGKNKADVSDPKIEPVLAGEIDEVIKTAALIFSNVMEYKDNVEYLSKAADFNKSVKLINNGEIIGCYLIKDRELKDLPGKKGIEGVALAIKPAYRGIGLGEALKDWLEEYAKNKNYDFIFGAHLKGLHNIDDWLKRRELYKETDSMYFTIKYL